MKTAGTSLEIALANACGPDDVVARIVPPETALLEMPQLNFDNAVITNASTGNRQVIRQHSGLARAIAAFGSTIRDYRIITSERNPWDKLVSSFYWKLHQTPNQILEPGRRIEDLDGEALQYAFRRFVLSPVKDPCEAFDMYSQGWVPLVDYLVRFEELEHDLAVLVHELNLPNTVQLPKKASKSGIRPKAGNLEYDSALDRVVRRRFAREIAWFGYESAGDTASTYVSPSNLDAWKSQAFKRAKR